MSTYIVFQDIAKQLVYFSSNIVMQGRSIFQLKISIAILRGNVVRLLGTLFIYSDANEVFHALCCITFNFYFY